MQGGEYEMLQHADRILRSVLVIQTEYRLGNKYKGIPIDRLSDITNLLENYGFVLLKTKGVDALFVRKDLL